MKKIIIIAVLTALLAVLTVFVIKGYELEIPHYTVKTEKNTEPFRIAFIADLHSCKYGENQEELLSAVRAQNPDIVLFGGDIFGNARPMDVAADTLFMIALEYPGYYVTGNHEIRTGYAEQIKSIVRSCGVTVLDAENPVAEINGVRIYGFDDKTAVEEVEREAYIQKLSETETTPESFNILLLHRPEDAESYQNTGFDLMLSGHTHGGLWRIPKILNGFYAPGQGLFPKYVGGRYDLENMTLIISRGLARESTLIPRLFNHPELVIIDVE